MPTAKEVKEVEDILFVHQASGLRIGSLLGQEL